MAWPPPDPATVLPGDCRATLASLPPGVFQTCVTSIPYWGLRAYGTDPLEWGGDLPGCQHVWAEDIAALTRAPRDKQHLREWSETHGDRLSGPKHSASAAQYNAGRASAYCHVVGCNAWRGEYGSEPTLDAYIAHTVEVFRAVRRVLRPDGTLWLNVGDAYTGGGGYYPDAPSNQPDVARARGAPGAQLNGARIKTRPFSRQGLGPKQLLLIPARVALALQADGWVLRSEIIWAKQNPLPESVTDRPTKAHEQIYLFSLQPHYYYDADAVREAQSEGTIARFGNGHAPRKDSPKYANSPDDVKNSNVFPQGILSAGRNLRDVWPLASQSYNGAHFATFPDAIPRRAIRAGTSARGQCPACGAPWRRETTRTPMQVRNGHKAGAYGSRTTDGISGTMIAPAQTETTGWAPTCACDAGEAVPQWILDPFAGSGTTLAVARSLGRAAVGCELQPAYLPLSARRIAHAPVPLPALVEHL